MKISKVWYNNLHQIWFFEQKKFSARFDAKLDHENIKH